jgi:hypothetical protein
MIYVKINYVSLNRLRFSTFERNILKKIFIWVFLFAGIKNIVSGIR